MKRLDLPAWIRSQKQLLQIERETEIAQLSEKIASLSALECQDAGLSLLQLQIEGVSSGLFGRVVVSLTRQDKKPLPKSFKVGDEVSLYCPKSKHSSEVDGDAIMGIVSKTTQGVIDIVVDDIDEDSYPPPVRVDLRASEHTFKQYMKALSDLETGPPGPLSELFFGDGRDIGDTIETRPYHIDRNQLYNPNLNDSQIRAVESSIASSRLSVIHGPPGTGKTSTVAELILQAVNRHEQRLLVCAPSNVAVDNILERLVQLSKKAANRSSGGRKIRAGSTQSLQLRVARLGHPARVSPVTQPYCLDSLIARDDGSEIVADVRRDIDKLQKELSKRGKRVDRAQRREMQAEVRILRKEVRKREEAVVKGIMRSRQVILCTCTTASSRLIRDMDFDLVIIDEAAQAMEVACWIPLGKTRKCVLVGDHNQLPPTVKSSEAASGGLGVTLFERAIRDPRFTPVVHLLDIQYRMNRRICEWASQAMYEGALVSHPSVAEHTVAGLHTVTAAATTEKKATAASTGAGQIDHKDVKEEEEEVEVEEEEEEELLYDDDGVPVHIDRSAKRAARSTAIKNSSSSSSSANNTADGVVHTGDDDQEIVAEEPVMLLLDTAGAEMGEECANEGSYRNSGEAHVVMQHVLSLLDGRGLNPREIGVITPYNGQLEVLRQLFTADDTDPRLSLVEVRTVDGFQGGERECIVISMVRSNPRREVGFLGDKRRINVAVTRARRHLAIVCDTDTCCADPFIRGLIEHIIAVGEQRSVFEGYITELWQPPTGITTTTGGSTNTTNTGGTTSSTTAGKANKDAGGNKGKATSSESASQKNNIKSQAQTQQIGRGGGATVLGGTREHNSNRNNTAYNSNNKGGGGGATAATAASYAAAKAAREAANVAFKEEVKTVLKELKNYDHNYYYDDDYGTTTASGGRAAAAVVLVELYAGDMLRLSSNPAAVTIPVAAATAVNNQLSSLTITTQGEGEGGGVQKAYQQQVPGSVLLRFSSSLSSQQRRIVHEVAEESSIPHRSVGEGADRYIELSTRGFPDEDHHQPLQSMQLPPPPAAHTKTAAKAVARAAGARPAPPAATLSNKKPAPHVAINAEVAKQVEEEAGTKLISVVAVAAAPPAASTAAAAVSMDHNNNNKNSKSQLPLGGASTAPTDMKTAAVAVAPRTAIKGAGGGVYISAERAAAMAAATATLTAALAATPTTSTTPSSSIAIAKSSKDKKKMKSSSNSSSGAAAAVVSAASGVSQGGACAAEDGNDDDNELAMLEAAIEANKKLAHYNQYRLSSAAMPNPEKERNKEHLRSRIVEAQAARRVTVKEEEGKEGGAAAGGGGGAKGKQSSSNGSNKKVVKKPPPNFGGGRLGGSSGGSS